jgi:acyl-CoA reductase-like NAD-dependent aldehyde dehydrogenase
MLIIKNPANSQIIAELHEDNPKDIESKYERARKFQPIWASVPYVQRAMAIHRFRDLLVKNREELARTLSQEMGKPIAQARNEISGTLSRIDYFLENAEPLIAPENVRSDAQISEIITHEALGVVVNISAWNYPYFVGSNVFVPALLTGNTVLYKPSEFATLTGHRIEALLHEAGIPSDAFISVTGGGTQGQLLLQLPVDGVFFTGSLATGRKIAQTCAHRMIRLQLELGGKDPIYVCEDADVSKSAEQLADGSFYNAGQSCCAVERIYVSAKIHDDFVESFVHTVRSFKIGDPLHDETFLGPLARKSHLEVLENQVSDALTKGARLLAGGQRGREPGNYFEPTIFIGVDHKMTLMRDETFGPLIGIQKVSDDAEAIELMNDTHYGLTAGVYTRDRQRAQAVLSRIRSGTSYWNCCDRVSPTLPWSGRGGSGIGQTLSKYGILSFVQQRGWHLRA